MDAADLDYPLPASAIAQRPAEPRDAARLLVDRGPDRPVEHHTVADLADLLDPGDLLVVNDTRVIPARLLLRKPTGGAVEVLLLARRATGDWEALVKPSRRVADGTVLVPATTTAGGVEPDASAVTVTVGPVLGDDGRRSVTIGSGPGAGLAHDLEVAAAIGEIPLPPYIHESLADPDRYQTVFAEHPGSVAAPTAGLHLTEDVLERCRQRGITVARVELVVGLGTFRPITADLVEDHPMHAEHYRIPSETVALLEASRDGQVVAVGTTVVRALESWAATGRTEDDTRLFIHGQYRFGVVERLLTNFHVPRSSLLAMVQAFAGPRWKDRYAAALDGGYRFLSFGDAMLLDRLDDHTTGAP